MKIFHKILLAFMLVNIVPVTRARNFVGHVLLAQVAYDNLDPIAKQQATVLAEDLFSLTG